MVLAEDLRKAVLQAALQGKLTEQHNTDSDVEALLNKIQLERKRLVLEKKIKKVSIKPIKHGSVPYDIPSTWRWQRIGSFEEINLGFTYRPQYVNEGVYFLSVKDISSGKIDFSNAKKISQATYDKASYGSKPMRGDILFGRVCTMGKPQIIESDIPFCIFVSLGFFREHTNLMNKKYISYWMQSPLFYEQVNENVKGLAQKNLNTGWLKDFFVPIPPIEEQQRIVDKINEIMTKIDEYEKIEKDLETLKREFPNNMKDALLQAAMQGKLTNQLESDSSVDDLLASIKKEKKQLIKENKIYKDKKLVEDVENKFDIDIPYNWRFVNLQEICTQITDGEHKTPNRVSEYQGYYLLSARNILNGKLVLDDVDYVSKKEYDVISKRCNPHRNDILISCSGSVGRCCLINDDNNYVMVRSAAMIHCLQMNNKYIMYAIQSPYIQAQIDGLKKQSVQANLFQAAIASLLIPIPPIEEQERIVERLDVLLPLCEDLKEE